MLFNSIIKRYLFTRFLALLIIRFFLTWLKNINHHLDYYFKITGDTNSFLTTILIPITIALGLFTLNFSFTIIRYIETDSFANLISEINKNGVFSYLKKYVNNYSNEFSVNLNREKEREHYENLFFIFVFIFFFTSSNPLFNNYYGIYREYEVEGYSREIETTEYIQDKHFIYSKKKYKKMKKAIKRLKKNNYTEYDDKYYGEDFQIKRVGYTFIKAGIFDGFEDEKKQYTGFFSYTLSIFSTILEKILQLTVYFLIPFTLLILYQESKKIK